MLDNIYPICNAMAEENSVGVDVRFTYSLGLGDVLLNNIHLRIAKGQAVLIDGDSGVEYRLLGGIVAGLIPLRDATVPWEHMTQLLLNYTGHLQIHSGAIAATTAYVGPDPEQQLLFSIVEDNFKFLNVPTQDAERTLREFGLGPSFMGRRITSLSGGERMRVALASAFSRESQCYVLHGVIPWLDTQGRYHLLETIENHPDACVLFLEHEKEVLQGIVTDVYSLRANTLERQDPRHYDWVSAYSDLKPFAWDEKSSTQLPVLTLDGINLWDYPQSGLTRGTPILKDISFTVDGGTIACIVGPNGSGKSTIAKIAFGIIEADEGTVQVNGRRVSSMTRGELVDQIAFIGQFPYLQLTLPTVGDYRYEVRRSDEARYIIDKWITCSDRTAVVQLPELEQKILLLAFGITNRTSVIILDEPTWGLSKPEIDRFLEILEFVKGERRAFLVITHNRNFAHAIGGQILHLNYGQMEYTSKGDADSGKSITPEVSVESARLAEGGEQRAIDAFLRKLPVGIKLSGLGAVATMSFGFVFFVSEASLLKYSVSTILLSAILAAVLRAVAGRLEFRLLMVHGLSEQSCI